MSKTIRKGKSNISQSAEIVAPNTNAGVRQRDER